MNRLRSLARFAPRREAVRFVHHVPRAEAGHHVIYMYDREGLDFGRLDWHICHTCHRGRINKISIRPGWQRLGLGRRLVARALRDGPDYTWFTSVQSPEAQEFFPALTAETGTAFPVGSKCSHMTAVIGAEVLNQRKVAEHDI